MDQLDTLVSEAIAAFKAGRKEEARTKLLSVIEQNERHEQAWLWLSGLMDSIEEREICLENVLAINPNNERARKGLEKLRGSTPAAPVDSPTPTAPRAPANDPFGDASFSAFDAVPGASFDSAPSGGDASLFGDVSFEQFKAGPVSSTPDPFGSEPGGAWGADDIPAFHGGDAADVPSATPDSDWVSELNIGSGTRGADPIESSPFDSEDAFGSEAAPWETDDDTFDGMDEAAPFDAGDAFAVDESFVTPEPARASAFDSAFDFDDENPGAGILAFGAAPAATMDDDDDDDDVVSFDFDDDNAGGLKPSVLGAGRTNEFVFGGPAVSVPVQSPEGASAGAGTMSGASAQAYYSQIPSEIEAVPGGIPRQSLMLVVGVLVLVVLNLASFGFLIMNL